MKVIQDRAVVVQSELGSANAANVVEGFSERFNLLLDRARVPRENRVKVGAKRFDVVHNTFKAWCQGDRIPGSHSSLVEIVEALLKEIPGRYSSRAVVAWLLAGDAVPHPFQDDTDALATVELYLQITDIASRQGIEFDQLPREVRNQILKHVLKNVRVGREGPMRPEEGLQLDDSAIAVVVAMLETASVPRGPATRGG